MVAICVGSAVGCSGLTAMKRSVKPPISVEKNNSSRMRGWNSLRKMANCATM